jgi:hypothetical protein
MWRCGGSASKLGIERAVEWKGKVEAGARERKTGQETLWEAVLTRRMLISAKYSASRTCSPSKIQHRILASVWLCLRYATLDR